MRGVVVWVLMLGLAYAANAKPPSMTDYAKAYAMALRCTVYSITYKDEASAKRAFDAAIGLGKLQGFSDAKVNDDFNAAIARETVRLRQEAGYPTKTRADCKALSWAT